LAVEIIGLLLSLASFLARSASFTAGQSPRSAKSLFEIGDWTQIDDQGFRVVDHSHGLWVDALCRPSACRPFVDDE